MPPKAAPALPPAPVQLVPVQAFNPLQDLAPWALVQQASERLFGDVYEAEDQILLANMDIADIPRIDTFSNSLNPTAYRCVFRAVKTHLSDLGQFDLLLDTFPTIIDKMKRTFGELSDAKRIPFVGTIATLLLNGNDEDDLSSPMFKPVSVWKLTINVLRDFLIFASANAVATQTDMLSLALDPAGVGRLKEQIKCDVKLYRDCSCFTSIHKEGIPKPYQSVQYSLTSMVGSFSLFGLSASVEQLASLVASLRNEKNTPLGQEFARISYDDSIRCSIFTFSSIGAFDLGTIQRELLGNLKLANDIPKRRKKWDEEDTGHKSGYKTAYKSSYAASDKHGTKNASSLIVNAKKFILEQKIERPSGQCIMHMANLVSNAYPPCPFGQQCTRGHSWQPAAALAAPAAE